MNILFQFDVRGTGLDQAGKYPRAIALKEKLGWLLEWEHAQREARGRPHGNTAVPESPGEPIHNSQRSVASVSEPMLPLSSIDKDGLGVMVSQTTSYRSVETMHIQSVFGTGLQDRPRLPCIPVAIPAEQAPDVPVMDPVKAARDSRVTQLWESLNAREWQPFLVNITRTGNGIRVWIRDPRNQAHLWIDVVSVLRREIAKSGLVMDSLVVNGCPIWGASFDEADASTTPGGADERDIDEILNRIF